ncbi:MAG: WbqC family protein [Acidobacteria bacterium]|nr:WbqC family protein [Acidobacteriota bacterium]
MRIGISQSNYIPWRGYFDLIDSVDLFIILDDVKYSRGTWRNRNRVKTNDGLKWLTVPVSAGAGRLTIDHVQIARANRPWQEQHRGLLSQALGLAPYFGDASDIWQDGVSHEDSLISELNIRLIKKICSYLRIETPIAYSGDYDAPGRSTERVINLVRKAGGSVYLSGPAARGYLDESQFSAEGIRLEYKSYDYEPYPQLWGDFVGTVSVLDLIANTGPHVREFLKSKSPNVVAVK